MTTPNLLVIAGSITIPLTVLAVMAFQLTRPGSPLGKRKTHQDPNAPVLVSIHVNQAARLEVSLDRGALNDGGLEALGDLVADAARRAGLQDSEGLDGRPFGSRPHALRSVIVLILTAVTTLVATYFSPSVQNHRLNGLNAFLMPLGITLLASMFAWFILVDKPVDHDDGHQFRRAAEDVARWLRPRQDADTPLPLDP